MNKPGTILIAGSSGQIGNALCKHLLENTGHFVVGVDVVANEMKNTRFEFHEGSVLDQTFLDTVATQIADSGSQLKGIVNSFVFPEFNNALPSETDELKKKFPNIAPRTIELLSAWSNYPTSQALNSFEINCLGANNVVSSQLENLLHSGSSSVVHVASQYGIKVPRQELFKSDKKFTYKPFAYSTSKAALIKLSEYHASLFAGTNVRVNSVSPGVVYRGQPDDFVRRFENSTWTRKLMGVEEVVQPIAFLLSGASSYINGSNLVIDGGWTQT